MERAKGKPKKTKGKRRSKLQLMEVYHCTQLYGKAALQVGLWPTINMCDEHMSAIQRLHYLEHMEVLDLEKLLPLTSEDVDEVEKIIRDQLPKSKAPTPEAEGPSIEQHPNEGPDSTCPPTPEAEGPSMEQHPKPKTKPARLAKQRKAKM